MKNACVLGMGASGRAAARYLRQLGFSVTCVEDHLKQDDWKSSPEIKIEDFTLFVPSPGIPRTHPLYVMAKKAGIEIAGEMELALRQLTDHLCIGVTGTNGKTTVVTWIEQFLNDSGILARAVGNVGNVLLEYLENKREAEVLIVEVSSFQLETLRMRAFDLGFILNITEDHLYRYSSFDEYGFTKCQLEKCMKGQLHVYGKAASQFRHHLQHPFEIYEIDPIVKTGHWIAPHDLENATVVWRVAQYFGIPPTSFCQGLASLGKPPHRIEYVAMVDGVTYYNDSKATNVDAVLKALSAMTAPVILLAGGMDKGGSFSPILLYRERIRCILAFGQSREKIASELGDVLPVEPYLHMDAAIKRAYEVAKSGEIVLLSPGCASFDGFTSYAHRGEQFKEIINQRRRHDS